MASFKGILRGIFEVGHAASPLVSSIWPPFAAIDLVGQKIIGAVSTAELQHPEPGQGAVKSAQVIADLSSHFAFANDALAVGGHRITWDADALQKALNEVVSGMNAMSAFKATIKIESV